MRGEHVVLHRATFLTWGSSPHARGARAAAEDRPVHVGIIPACAGSTPARPRRLGGRGDHPRMRGEHMLASGQVSSQQGSSPHARGARHVLERDVHGGGIIPACAGSTTSRCTTASRRGDHPRMRGEHFVSRSPTAWFEGSSPHARGAQRDRRRTYPPPGIIPACAGSTPRP